MISYKQIDLKFHQTLDDDVVEGINVESRGSRSRSQRGQIFEWVIAMGGCIHFI